MAFREHTGVFKFAIFYATLNEKCFSHVGEILNHILQTVVTQNHKGISHIRNVNHPLNVGTSEMSNTPGFSISTNSWEQVSVKSDCLFFNRNKQTQTRCKWELRGAVVFYISLDTKWGGMKMAFIHCWCSWILCCHSLWLLVPPCRNPLSWSPWILLDLSLADSFLYFNFKITRDVPAFEIVVQ